MSSDGSGPSNSVSRILKPACYQVQGVHFLMSEILPIVQLLHHYANLQPPVTITFEQLIKFIAYSSHLKDNLLLVLGPAILLFSLMGLPILSPAIQLFLSEACSIPLDAIPWVWVALANIAWTTKLELSSTDGNFKAAYRTFGHTQGICMHLKLTLMHDSHQSLIYFALQLFRQ